MSASLPAPVTCTTAERPDVTSGHARSLPWGDCQRLVESILDYAIYSLDQDGIVTSWNLGAARIKGYTADEVIGRHFSTFFSAHERESGKPARELSLARQLGRHEDEGWRVRKDGSQFWANAVVTALHDSTTGALIGYASITRDLTARRDAEQNELRLAQERAAREVAERAEQQIRESEERYRALSQRLEIVLEGVADGITVQDRSGTIVFANSAAAKICGFETGEELMRTPPQEVVARFEVLDEAGNPYPVHKLPGRRVLSGEKSATAALHVRHRKTRREWWSLVRASAVIASDGSHELAINIWHDITEQRRHDLHAQYLADVTAALSTSLVVQQMMAGLARALVPGLGDWCSVYLLEAEDLANVAVAHVDPAKVQLAKDYHGKFKPDPGQRTGVWSVLRTGQSETYNDISDEMLRAYAADPERLAALRAVGMRAALAVPIRARSRVMGVISLVFAESDRRYVPADVTFVEELGRRTGVALENAELYASAQAAAAMAEAANRAKDDFLATVSHELRTPLNAILGWSAILAQKVKDPAIAKPLAVIHRNAEAQVQIVDDILDVSRIIAGKLRIDPQPADLVAIARDAVEAVRASAAAKHVALEFAPASDYLLFIADRGRVQQVIANLLSNAVKFTDSGGIVRVAVRQDGASLVVRVEDNGRGIAREFLPFVFERFRQADSSLTRQFGGLGLGLALVRYITELHGGEVKAESAGLGKGAVFTVRLPMRASAPGELQPAQAPEPQPQVGALVGVRVLVVDDEADARELVSAVLVDAGGIVETAASAPAAFEALSRFRPDVLVSDIGMPGEDGLSLIRQIRALPDTGGRIPALALTALAREEDRVRAISSGYTTYLSKPLTPNALTGAVARLASLVSKARLTS